MRPVEAPIFSLEGICNWETNLIRGALYYNGIASRVVDNLNFVDSNENAFCIVHSIWREKDFINDRTDEFKGTKILAGRAVTLEYLQKKFPLKDNEILIYGEPYALIPDIIKDQKLMERLKGKAILGPLLNPAAYRSPPAVPSQNDWVYILTSLGCQKKCGYCTYGATYSHLYSKAFLRRARPWQDIKVEMAYFMSKGIDQFVLLADQFLSKTPQDNLDLLNLSLDWNPEKNGRPMLIFTVSPLEILSNKALFETMSCSFRLYPRYSIDSFDNDTLNLFDLGFNALEAMEALKFLSHLKLPFRINYIFIRPGMTLGGIKKELNFFKSLDNVTFYLDPYEKLLLARDLFSTSLNLMQGSPLMAGDSQMYKQYENDLPREVFKIVSKIQSVMVHEVNKINDTYIKNGNPLKTIIEAGLDEIKIFAD